MGGLGWMIRRAAQHRTFGLGLAFALALTLAFAFGLPPPPPSAVPSLLSPVAGLAAAPSAPPSPPGPGAFAGRCARRFICSASSSAGKQRTRILSTGDRGCVKDPAQWRGSDEVWTSMYAGPALYLPAPCVASPPPRRLLLPAAPPPPPPPPVAWRPRPPPPAAAAPPPPPFLWPCGLLRLLSRVAAAPNICPHRTCDIKGRHQSGPTQGLNRWVPPRTSSSSRALRRRSASRRFSCGAHGKGSARNAVMSTIAHAPVNLAK